MAGKPARTRRSRAPQQASKPEGAAGPPIVVYVHGIGSQKPDGALKTEWDIALFGSDQGEATRMAYWSDIVHPPARGGTTRARRVKSAGSGDPVREALGAAGVSPDDAALAYGNAIAGALGAPPAPGRGPGKKVLPLPGFLRKPISEAFMKAFIGDTAAYFFDGTKRRAIRSRLTKQLPADGTTPVTVVAHSQGSVVALEVLSALGRRVNVVKLVTIGSPLGLQEVQDFLDVPPRRKPFEVSESIQKWHNFADILDPVALDKELRSEFLRAEPDDDEAGQALVTDDIIVSDTTRRAIGFNPHSAVGYLAHPKVRRSVYDAAQRDSMARFVVARDVAESLAVDARHPLIVEILEPGYPALGESASDCEQRERGEKGAQREVTLASRVDATVDDLRALVRATAERHGEDPAAAVTAARIEGLRRFVAGRLTPDEIRQVAVKHKELKVYAVWKSTRKRKLIERSRVVLQADAALESYGASGKGIVWAVLDTGVRADHAHFRRHENIKAVWDCTRVGRPVRIAEDRDRDGHGSHVCGIIAGASQENIQRMGVAPEAKLIVYKVLNDRGEGEDAWIIKALDHIAFQNENAAGLVIHGINLSLGGPYDSTVYGCGFTPICQELRRQWRAGVLVVVACGNEGQLNVQTGDGEVEINTPMSIGDPANLEDCIAVGSVNADRPHSYGVSAFSSRGPTSDGRMKPDVVAPGERITSVNTLHASGRHAYRVESGTSMAAPHVSGLLAGFLSARREFRGRPDEVKRIVLETCTDIGRDRYHQGRGIPNLMRMLLSV